jgi:hypothetical protein
VDVVTAVTDVAARHVLAGQHVVATQELSDRIQASLVMADGSVDWAVLAELGRGVPPEVPSWPPEIADGVRSPVVAAKQLSVADFFARPPRLHVSTADQLWLTTLVDLLPDSVNTWTRAILQDVLTDQVWVAAPPTRQNDLLGYGELLARYLMAVGRRDLAASARKWQLTIASQGLVAVLHAAAKEYPWH